MFDDDDSLMKPIHGYATDEVNRSRSTAYLTKVFKKAAGLRGNLPAGSTFAIAAKAEGRFDRLLKFEKDHCLDMRVRKLRPDGRPLKPRRGSGGATRLVIFTERPPKFLP